MTHTVSDAECNEQTIAAITDVFGILRLDPDGRVISVNEFYQNLCGYAEAELVGDTLAKLAHPDGDKDPPVDWEAIRAGHKWDGVYRRKAKDQSTYWIHALYTPILDENGMVAEVAVVVFDVTESRRQMRRLEANLDAVERSQAVIEFEPDGTIIRANANFCNALGYSLDEIKGRKHSMFVKPDYASSAAYQTFWEEIRAGKSHLGEFERVGKDGESVYILASYNAIQDSRGKVVRVVKFASDITEQKRGIYAINEALDRLSKGDLTARMPDSITGDFESVRVAFNEAMMSFATLVDRLRAQSATMEKDAAEIANGARDLASRGESQAASLEETAAAVEEISGNIEMTSEAARDANSAAFSAQETVQKGAKIVQEAIDAMLRIEEHTKQMADFTRVIENFAFQTNLLSINAAVEAARAGEVGRGFAVVAGEVRNLAQQSANASQNIAELIGKSEAEVKAGVRLVTDAGGSLDDIQKAVTGMVENISGIAHATTEQATGVREVSQALSTLDSTNQANLALSESYAGAAASLSAQVEELTAMLGKYSTQAPTRSYASDIRTEVMKKSVGFS